MFQVWPVFERGHDGIYQPITHFSCLHNISVIVTDTLSCIIIGLICVADAHRNQIHSGSHRIPPVHLHFPPII